MKVRTVVTGMGVVSCVGCDTETFWSSLIAGRSGIRPVERLELAAFPYRYGGEVSAEKLSASRAHMDEIAPGRSETFCVQAANEATGSLKKADFLPERAAVVLATNFGPMDTIEQVMAMERNGERIPQRLLRCSMPDWTTRAVSHSMGFEGPGATLSLSCASGGTAIGHGVQLIRNGICDVVLAGGYDTIELTTWAGLGVLRVMCPTPKEGPPLLRPFDKDRNGTLFSEGAAFLLLESEEHAIRRKAFIHAVVSGWAANNNAFHMTHADPESVAMKEVMASALDDAELSGEQVDHINAHGTATRLNDKLETLAIKKFFGSRTDEIPVTSIKGTVGHGMGAAGGFEAIACIKSITDGLLPPTINYCTPDPECDLNIVTHSPIEERVDYVLSNSAGIGGCNSTVIFGRWPGNTTNPA